MMRCFVRLVEKQYVPFLFYCVKKGRALALQCFPRQTDHLPGARGGQLHSLQSNLCVLKCRSVCISHAEKAWGKKKKVQAQFRHEAPVQRLQCGILKAMSVVFNAQYKASKDSLCLVCLICLICSRMCVFTVEPVTVFIVWLLWCC